METPGKHTYWIERSDGYKREVHRASYQQQGLIIGAMQTYDHCRAQGNFEGVRMCEQAILCHALQCSNDELQAELGKDPDCWPEFVGEMVRQVMDAERPALYRSWGLKPDGTVTAERQRLIHLEKLLEQVNRANWNRKGDEWNVCGGFGLDAATCTALGIKADEERQEGEQSGPPADGTTPTTT